MTVTKIVITGGPCAGKTTAMSWIQNAFSQKGYTVLFVPETATELITGGVAPWTCGTNLEYQKCQMRLQMEKERLFEQAARTMPDEKILIVCDRGALDNKAYMTQDEFAQVAAYVGSNEVELRDQYDAVFHLVTAAKGATEFYTTANNAARTETVEQAVALDDKLMAAWAGHPHFRIIDNSCEFEDKMKHLIGEISSFLGETALYEVERKFLIEYPDISWLESLPNCRRVEIIQTYLKTVNHDVVHLRQRGIDGHYIYIQTIKREVDNNKRVEIERRLSQGEYLRLLMEADYTKRQLRKTRYCLISGALNIDIDIYPFWSHQAICKTKLSDENATILFPDKVKVIREITGDPAYKMSSLAALNLDNN